MLLNYRVLPRHGWHILVLALLCLAAASRAQPSPAPEACPPGWRGNACVLCASDAACTAQTGSPEGTCSASPLYAPNSRLMAYSCSLGESFLATIIAPGSVHVQCRTGLQEGGTLAPAPEDSPSSASEGANPASEGASPASEGSSPASEAAPGGRRLLEDEARNGRSLLQSEAASPAPAPPEGSHCDISLGIASSNTTVACRASACAMSPGSGRVYCSSTSCDCGGGGCPPGLVAGLVTGVNGPASIDCSPTGACSLALTGLPVSSIELTCEAAECLAPSREDIAPMPVPKALEPTPSLAGAVAVAALPLVFLLAVAALLGAYFLRNSALLLGRESGSCCPLSWKSGERDKTSHQLLASKGSEESKPPASKQPELTTTPKLPGAGLGEGERVELRWEGLSVSVDLAVDELFRKRAALQAQEGRRGAAGEDGGSMPSSTPEEGALLRLLHQGRGLVRRRRTPRRSLGTPLSRAEDRGDSWDAGEGSPHPPPEPSADMAARRGELEAVVREFSEGRGVGGGGEVGDMESAQGEIPRTPSVPLPYSSTPARLSSSNPSAARAAACALVCDLHCVSSPARLPRAARLAAWTVVSAQSGRVLGGELVGLLGPSGCGKTSLLAALAGSRADLGPRARVAGSVLLDGLARARAGVAFVPQADELLPTLTVRETVRYAAALRLRGAGAKDVVRAVEDALAEVGLAHVADSLVGGGGGVRGVSGGERRRTAIAQALVAHPRVLVLDEPTSGLDSAAALSLIRALRAVADRQRAVLLSLHQPSREVVWALDRAVLMAHGRRLLDEPPRELDLWCAARGVSRPEGAAVAEHLLALASDPLAVAGVLRAGEGRSSESEGEGKGGEGAERADSERVFVFPAASTPDSNALGPPQIPLQIQMPTPCASPQPHLPAPPSLQIPPPAPPSPPFARQLAVLSWRTGVDLARAPALLRLHASVALLMGVLMGAIFFQVDATNVGVQNRLGGAFFALAFLGFGALTAVDLLVAERRVVAREVGGGMYGAGAYVLSKLVLDGLLLRALPALLFCAPFYAMAGFRGGAGPVLLYALCLVTFSCAMGAFTALVARLARTPGAASFGVNLFVLFCVVFTGFLVQISSIPTWLSWLHYLSLFFYAFEAMVTSQINGKEFTFNAAGQASVENIKGEVYLRTLGFDPAATQTDVIVLVAMYFGLVLLCVAVYCLKAPRSGGGQSWLWRPRRRLGAPREGTEL